MDIFAQELIFFDTVKILMINFIDQFKLRELQTFLENNLYVLPKKFPTSRIVIGNAGTILEMEIYMHIAQVKVLKTAADLNEVLLSAAYFLASGVIIENQTQIVSNITKYTIHVYSKERLPINTFFKQQPVVSQTVFGDSLTELGILYYTHDFQFDQNLLPNLPITSYREKIIQSLARKKNSNTNPLFDTPKYICGIGQTQTQQPSTFGQTQTQPKAGTFGQTQQPSIFGQTQQPSTFGQTQQPSTFGQTQTQTQPKAGTFGQTQQPSIFGQTQTQTQPKAGTFGQTQTQTQTLTLTRKQVHLDKHNNQVYLDKHKHKHNTNTSTFGQTLTQTQTHLDTNTNTNTFGQTQQPSTNTNTNTNN